MRRSEKEIDDIGVIEEILRTASVCRLGLCEGNRPYVVPLCFGYEENALYVHCASQGKKMEILRKNKNVCFEVDIEQEFIKGETACDCGMKYRSVIGFGKAVFVEDAESKRKALDIIMQNYLDGTFEYLEEAVEKTVVVKIEIESMSGKKSG